MLSKKTQHRSKNGSIAALDIGTSKVACFIAHEDARGNLSIKGIGHQLSKGIRAGVITDVAEAETSIVAAVHAAEQMAGETIDSVVVNLSCAGILSRHVTVELAVSGEGVSEQDIADIIYEGQVSIQHPEQDTIHCFPVSYFIDSTRGIKDPRQMVGNQLGADLHMVTAPAALVRNMANCVARCHLNVSEFVVAPHASALAALEQDERDLGATVIDMGGGVTSVAVFAGGKNIFTDAISIGGMHVTNDIAKGLSTTLAHAERLKTLHGSAISSPQDEQVMIDVPQLGEHDGHDEGNLLPRSMLVGIIRPRIEEIFEMIRGRIEASGTERMAGRRVVLTGGASQLLGVRDMAARVLGKQVRLGRPPVLDGLAEAVSGPAFATAIGMLDFAVDRPMEDAFFKPRRPRVGLGARLEGVLDWVKENF